MSLLVVLPAFAMAQGGTVVVDNFNIKTLTFDDPAGVLDVNEYGIVTVTPFTGIQTLVASGNIISTKAATDPSGVQTLAIINGDEYANILGGAFHGHTVVSTDTLLQRSYYGDANLDGVVNVDDYGYIDAGYGGNNGWILGDFDNNGVVNVDDYGYIDAGYGQPVAAAASAATVPEPSTLVLLFGSALAGFVAYLRKR
jgi:hypothetical protein